MANVFDVADFFDNITNLSEDNPITNLKLNKLLYFAQGVFLARTGKPLFDDDFEAWPYGPVVPAIYHKYKVCGRNPISTESQDIDRSIFAEDELETLLDVMREYGKYTGEYLLNLTHRLGTPWSIAAFGEEKKISLQDMESYFKSHPIARLKDIVKIPEVDSLPADWYDPDEDSEWEGYL